jgi:cell division septation protein DedD
MKSALCGALTVAAALAVASPSAQGLDAADCNAALSYLSTMPPKEALKLTDSLSRAAGAPGWARARALRVSGDHLFLREEYKKAAEAYLQASRLDTVLMYRHLYAVSMAMDGQPEPARAIWNEIALDKTNELSEEATRLSALLPKPAPEPVVAAPVNPQSGALAQTQIVASANQQNSALAQTQIVVPANRQNSAIAQTQIVAPVNQQKNVSVQSLAGSAGQPNNTSASIPVFTIQVGAFASKENADNLVKRLTGKYEDITTSVAITNDQTLYRVRVGSFPKKEDAIAFADKLIVEAGLSARVVEK